MTNKPLRPCKQPGCPSLVSGGYCEKCAIRHRPNVTIVCGPPGSGKTSYALNHMGPGDLIVDLDLIWQALTGLDIYNKPEKILNYVLAAREAIFNELEKPDGVERSWIVICGAKRKEREWLRRRFNAKVLMMDVTKEECLRRVREDKRRAGQERLQGALVEKWFREYEA